MTQAVLFDSANGVGWITLNQPESRNALSLEVMAAIQDQLNQAAEDPKLRVLVIRGAGPAFCAGHNLKEMMEEDADIHHYRRIFAVCSKMMQSIHAIPQPVIAQVHGIATAAGCQLVAACDLAIAGDDARFATPGVKIGLFCTTPMVPLCRVIGRRRALDMLLSGRFVDASEALEFGLVNQVVSSDALAEKTRQWAEQLAQASRFTLGFGKQAFYRQIDSDEGTAYGYAQEAIAMNCLAEDAKEGIGAFLEKRDPRWKDR